MKPLKIYLGDLTYDTIVISTEAFPLNIGYVASYCKASFGNKVDITLFKYIDDLDRAINNSPPDILGLSNYCWNQRIGLAIFRMLLKLNPNALTVWGGPNFPIDLESQEKFLNKNPEVDIYVPIEGEVGFSNIVERALQINSSNNFKEQILDKPIEGCIIRSFDGNLRYENPVKRITMLDEIPSPYTTGLLDKFFDGKLTPMLQTNRGCPFSCTFCVDGSDLVKQVNKFSIDRAVSEINYIAQHVPSNMHTLHISDLNFGMIPRDLEICDALARTQKEYHYPQNIIATTGKNAKERIIDAISRLNGALRFIMSVQSMDQDVLANIRRDNISVDQMMALGPAIKKARLDTATEVILGLPGETYDSHIETLRELIRARIDNVQIYTCMLLPGSQLHTPQERHKWGLRTKFRILPRDFAKLSNGKNIVEIEECVVGTNTLSFDEYVELRLLAFTMWVTSIGVYEPILKLLEENHVEIFEVFHRTVKLINNAPKGIKEIFKRFKSATIDELWNSPEEIEEHYQNDKEYNKLLNGEAGINVIQFHHALVTSEYIDEWTEYTLSIAFELLRETHQFDSELNKQFHNVANYCRGTSHNILHRNRMHTNPELTFEYDIKNWIYDSNDMPLGSFKFTSPTKITFKLTDEQFKLIEDELDIHGDTPTGKGQVLKRVPLQKLWRTPTIII